MNALVLLLIPATIGVDFGWERQPDNSIQYILQIEPEAVDSMKTGTELRSSLPPALRNISDYRLRVGRDRLPNQNTIPPELNTAAATGAQPNIAGGNYATAQNYPTNSTGNYATNNYGTNNYATGTNNGTGFANNSTATQQQPYYGQPGTLPANNTGLSPIGNPQTVPTSTSGWPLQTTNATYPTNNNQTLANLPPPPQGNYPTNGYPPNAYAAGTAQPNGYAPTGYNNAPGYNNPAYNNTAYNNTNPYGPNNAGGYNPGNFNNGQPNYQQPYPNQPNPNQPYANQPYQQQPYQQQPVNPYGQQPNYYLAQNTGPAFPSGYSDPRSVGAAKPSLDPAAPAGTGYLAGTNGSFPPGTQFTQPGATPTGTGQLNPFPPLNGANPGVALNGNGTPIVNTGATTTIDPHTGATITTNPATAKESQSQWASLSFALIALFASIGANIYIGWQNHYLRERCRMLVADRAAY